MNKLIQDIGFLLRIIELQEDIRFTPERYREFRDKMNRVVTDIHKQAIELNKGE